jgi:hypothetical protein
MGALRALCAQTRVTGPADLELDQGGLSKPPDTHRAAPDHCTIFRRISAAMGGQTGAQPMAFNAMTRMATSLAASSLLLAGTQNPVDERRNSQAPEADQCGNEQDPYRADSSGLFRFGSGSGTVPLREQLGRNRIFVHWAPLLNGSLSERVSL